MVSDHAHMIRVTVFRPKAGSRDDLAALSEAMAERIRKIEGCYGVQVCDVREEPDWLAVISRWENPANLDRVDSVASQGERERAASLLAEQPRVYHLTPR